MVQWMGGKMENLKRLYEFLVASATFEAPRGYHGAMEFRPALEIGEGGTHSPAALQGDEIVLCDINAEERGFAPLGDALRTARDRREQRNAIETFLKTSEAGKRLRRQIEDRLRKSVGDLLTTAAALRY
jgi:hypothetical protein